MTHSAALRRAARATDGYRRRMRFLKGAALVAVGKRLYDESRKPHNKARIDRAVQSLRERRAGRGRTH